MHKSTALFPQAGLGSFGSNGTSSAEGSGPVFQATTEGPVCVSLLSVGPGEQGGRVSAGGPLCTPGKVRPAPATRRVPVKVRFLLSNGLGVERNDRLIRLRKVDQGLSVGGSCAGRERRSVY